jgi:putative methyltransferase (TIGR04325 family)
MNRWTVKLFKSIPWSLISRSPSFGYVNTWIGVFPSWTAAMEAIPPGTPIGYNQKETKEIFLKYPTARVRPSDYAVLLHLRKILRNGMRVVDAGGSIGMGYYIAQKYFPLPEALEWVVFDLPEVLEAGREVAIREGEKGKGLRFVGNLAQAGACDIFLSSGSLQLMEEPLSALLKKLPSLPQHILINRIPVWDREAVVTLNDLGYSLGPYNVFNRSAWIQSVEELGYTLVDEWACSESNFFSIRFHKGTHLDSYRGFYFARNSPGMSD